jgi:hypothetical protein
LNGGIARAITAQLQWDDQPRSASQPPQGAYNIVEAEIEVAAADQVRLIWTQRNTGDYDFNGVVNIADLTPLAAHFQESYDSGDPNRYALATYWIDGDRNSEINLADITAIARYPATRGTSQRFAARLSGLGCMRCGAAANANA